MSMVLAPLSAGPGLAPPADSRLPSDRSPESPASASPRDGGRSLAAYDASLHALQAGGLPSGMREHMLSVGREGERYLVVQVEPRPPARMEAVRQAYIVNGRILQAVDSALRIDRLG